MGGQRVQVGTVQVVEVVAAVDDGDQRQMEHTQVK